ncbi:uncharacterized protein [Lepeophtheirus salmonis]|uniref:uncharacterized protein n=1 Tax=Lepeophtheirus salmonis TaxID=72036 RepID=UPI001AE63155|nr:uncharacterized protein LOC121122359 [Lepeophtheirus salmonis]
MAIEWKNLKTPNGYLKIAEIILAYIIMILASTGGWGYYIDELLQFGGPSSTLFALGTIFSFCFILPGIMISYVLGSTFTVLEEYFTGLGAIFSMIVGAITLNRFSYIFGRSHDFGIAVGCLSILLSLILLADFLIGVKKANISLLQSQNEDES